MKMKRMVACVLALLLMVSLLPIGAMADDLPNNEYNQVPINHPIGTNSGTGVSIGENGSVQTNTGSIEENKGTVSTNNGKIVENKQTVENNVAVERVPSEGEVSPVYQFGTGYIENNNNLVKTNGTQDGGTGSGIIETNNGTIDTNYGYVGVKDSEDYAVIDDDTGNFGTITSNYGYITQNENLVATNGKDGSSSGYIYINDGTVKNNETAVCDNNGTVIINNGEVTNNKVNGTVETNNNLVKDNYGTVVTNNGNVRENDGTVVTNNGRVENNYGTVTINNIDGTVHNYNGGEVVPMSLDDGDAAPSEDKPVVAGVGTNFGTVTNYVDGNIYYGLSWGDNVNNLNRIESFVEKGTPLDLDVEAAKAQRSGYKMTGYTAYRRVGGEDKEITDAAGYTMDAPTWLKILWEQIVKPASSNEPEAKPAKTASVLTSLSADKVKVGTFVRCGNMIFKIIEVNDDSIRVATVGKLSEQDLADMLAFLKQHLSDAQIAKLIGEPELLEEELVTRFFADNREHIAFRAEKDLFET